MSAVSNTSVSTGDPFFDFFAWLSSWIGSYGDLAYRVLVLIAAISVSYIIGKYVSKILLRTLSKAASINVAKISSKIFFYIIIFLGFLVGITAAGVDITTLVIASGFLGIVIGLAAQSSLGEAIAGIFFVAEGSVKVGDLISVGDIVGHVVDIGFLSTKVRKLNGEYIRVPNSELITSRVINLSKALARRLDIPVGISYSSDIGKAIKVIRKVLERSKYVLAEPEPMILVESLGDSSVNLLVYAWIPQEWWWESRKVLIKEIKEALDREGIEIPFPQRVVWLREIEKK